jgi:ParB family transcriptional regulator, chromosome partitioning protein
MAVEFEVKGTRTSEYLFFPEQLEIDPALNGRHDLPDVSWIVESILAHGQLQPVTIRREGGKPVLVAGFSRWRAVSHINKKKLTERPIALRCSYTQLTEKQAFLANIEENRVRNATTPMDDAYNLQRLVNVYQMTHEECAEAYRASVAWVKGRLKLIEATPEVEKQIRAGKIKGPAAQAVAKLSKEHQKNLAKVADEKGKVTKADIAKETGKPEPAKKPEKNILEMADSLARLVLDDKVPISEVQYAAKAYAKVRGLDL